MLLNPGDQLYEPGIYLCIACGLEAWIIDRFAPAPRCPACPPGIGDTEWQLLRHLEQRSDFVPQGWYVVDQPAG